MKKLRKHYHTLKVQVEKEKEIDDFKMLRNIFNHILKMNVISNIQLISHP